MQRNSILLIGLQAEIYQSFKNTETSMTKQLVCQLYLLRSLVITHFHVGYLIDANVFSVYRKHVKGHNAYIRPFISSTSKDF